MPENVMTHEAAGGIGAVPCRLKRHGFRSSNACNSINRSN
jgi:hypothetical protein